VNGAGGSPIPGRLRSVSSWDGGALVEAGTREHSRERGAGRDLVVPGERHLAH